MRALSIVGGGVRLLAGVGLVLSLGVGAPPAAQAAITLGAPRAVAGIGALSGVGCTSAGCVAVGSNSSNFPGEGVVVPVAADGTPGNARAVAGTLGLSGVGCMSAGCVAVGSNSYVAGEGVVVVPVAADGTPGSARAVAGVYGLSGVGCTSAGCVAVGENSSFPNGVVVVPNEGVVVPVAADGTPGSAQAVAGAYELRGVGCTSAGCIAVGSNSARDGVVVPIAADGTPGSVQTVAGTQVLDAVGCTSAGCVAVGESSAGDGVVVPVAADGTPGSARTVAGTQFLDGVGCTSAGCVAVGTNSYFAEGVVVPVSVTSSTPKPTPQPKPSCTLKPKTDLRVGALSLRVKCDRAASVKLTGTVKEPIGKKHHGKQRYKTFKLKAVSRTVKAGGSVALVLKLPGAALRALKHGAKESATLTLTGTVKEPIGKKHHGKQRYKRVKLRAVSRTVVLS